jgi:hypothetical protein
MLLQYVANGVFVKRGIGFRHLTPKSMIQMSRVVA